MYYTQRLKDLREDKDWTQADVANFIGIHRNMYQRYEAGENELKVGYLIKICKLYDVSADYILGFTNEKKKLPKK